ncbi:MAG: T9SS type A sorting domain-containing protein, partial [Flavipsychrobacter sp.]|nr:T9SS type A sorting domain-containing protein [Flavipsychrobacter sp.]
VCEGTTLVVNVVSVDGTGFQWYRNGIPLSNGGNVTGATGAILQVANTTSGDAGNYTVQLAPQSGCPPLLSAASAVTINPNASVIVPPVPSVTVCEGNEVTLSVTAGAVASYQWYRNGNALPNGLGVSGATTPNLRVSNADMSDIGTYHVLMTAYYTGCAGAISTNSQVNVTPLASTLAGNTATETRAHMDGMTHLYTAGNCDPIVKVADLPGGNTLGTTTSWVTIDGSVQEYNLQPYVTRHVDVVPGSSGLATVTLYATQADFDQYNAYIPVGAPQLPTGGIDNGNVMVMQCHGTGTIPGNYTGSTEYLTPTSVSWNGNWYEIVVPVGGFSGFYLYSDLGPLSVKMVDVKAENIGTRNVVSWKTATEEASCSFRIERSTDGISFTELGSVAGKGRASSYSFTDEAAVTGMNYYRVQLLDAGGVKRNSSVVSARVASGGVFAMNAYPNPVTEKVTVRFSEEAGAGATIELIDFTGKQLLVTQVSGRSAELDLGQVASGMYLVRYSDKETKQTIKINKQ